AIATTEPDGLTSIASPAAGWSVAIDPGTGEMRRSTARDPSGAEIRSTFEGGLPHAAYPARHPRRWRVEVRRPEGVAVVVQEAESARRAPEVDRAVLRWQRYASQIHVLGEGKIITRDGEIIEHAPA